jgi:hypothetical protein
MADKKQETVPDGVEDIDPQENLKQNSGSEGDGTVVASSDKKSDEVEDVIDTIIPKAEPKSWTLKQIGKYGELVESRAYVQRPLSFFGKMQWFSLVGEVIDKSISGDEGLRLSSLFEMPGRGGSFTASDFREADTFVQGVGKILVYAPDFLEKSYCIWLGVPDYEREWAKAVMNEPSDRGGLSDDDGLEIVEVFIDQNWESLEAFFREKIASLRARIQSHQKEETSDE